MPAAASCLQCCQLCLQCPDALLVQADGLPVLLLQDRLVVDLQLGSADSVLRAARLLQHALALALHVVLAVGCSCDLCVECCLPVTICYF